MFNDCSTCKPNTAASKSSLSHDLTTSVPVNQMAMVGNIGCLLEGLVKICIILMQLQTVFYNMIVYFIQ